MNRNILRTAVMCSVAFVIISTNTAAMADPIQPEEPQFILCKNIPIKAWGDPAEILKQIEDLDYTVMNLRIEKGCWEVKAFDSNRQVYEFYVHPISKDIVLKKHKPLEAVQDQN